MSDKGILEVEALLPDWAKYRLKLNGNNIGWPSKNIILSLSEGCGARYPTTGVCLILQFSDVEQIDFWVRSMGRIYPHLEDALTIFYCSTLPHTKVAHLLGISKRTLTQYLHDAKLWLCGRLQAIRDAREQQDCKQKQN